MKKLFLTVSILFLVTLIYSPVFAECDGYSDKATMFLFKNVSMDKPSQHVTFVTKSEAKKVEAPAPQVETPTAAPQPTQEVKQEQPKVETPNIQAPAQKPCCPEEIKKSDCCQENKSLDEKTKKVKKTKKAKKAKKAKTQN